MPEFRSVLDTSLLQSLDIKPDLLLRYQAIPLRREADTLHVGIENTTDQTVANIFSFHTGLKIQLVPMEKIAIDHLIDQYCSPAILYSQVATTLTRMHVAELNAGTDKEHQDEPVITFLNQLLMDACKHQVSDIHIEPYEKESRVRYRRDGLLEEATRLPNHLAARIITRLKILAHLNIAERRLPQDGRLTYQTSFKLEMRVSTCPTLFGEKMVLRLLNSPQTNLSLNKLGLEAKQEEIVTQLIKQPQGLIIVTGPTGSGKTITLYSIMQTINDCSKNIATIEDPVEIELPGINQLSIQPSIGLDFAKALRALLRQDPDIVMVGEIRDLETASIAIQAAQTGHLVLTTLHTNSAVEALLRLQTLGVDKHHLMDALTFIIAQRLVRVLCSHCKQVDDSSFYQAHGCHLCNQGYRKRTGIFEILPFTQSLRTLLQQDMTYSQIDAYLTQRDFLTLWKVAELKRRAGVTTIQEIKRVLNPPQIAYETGL